MKETLIGACMVAQSGGPTAVINASVYGVIKTAMEAQAITNVYGAAYGITGVLKEALYDLSQEDQQELAYLLNTPSAGLGSCRYKIADPQKDDKDCARILEIFQKHNIRYFFYIGGNDSMDTCNKVSIYLENAGYACRVMGVPKTIDNDLCGTDHTPGYGSAAKFIATTTGEIYLDMCAYDVGMVVVVEIMGRHTGWLAGASALASLSGWGPDLIYLPERPFSMEAFLADVRAVYQEKHHCLAAVSEGIHFADGTYVSEAKSSATDSFGHAQFGGLAARLAEAVKQDTGAKVRGIELSLLQRSGAHVAAQTDIDEAYQAGAFAVEQALGGSSGKMVAFARENENDQYRCRLFLEPLVTAANHEKKVPLAWINENGNYVLPEFIDYALPLIQGENRRPLENGLPRFAKLKKIPVK